MVEIIGIILGVFFIILFWEKFIRNSFYRLIDRFF